MKHTANTILLVVAAVIPCACTHTTVVEPPTPETTTTVHRETRTNVYPLDTTRTQTTTTIEQ